MRFTPVRRGKGAIASARHRAEVWPQILRRAGYVCEACGQSTVIEWSHLLGRGSTGLRLGDAWANLPECGAALCRPCHRSIDLALDLELRTALRWTAYWRLAHRFGIFADPELADTSPEDAIRALVRHLEDKGKTPEEGK